MVKADFVTGLAFLALGIAALIESLRMPRFETLAINPYTVPGIVPGLLGVVIAALGAMLALRAARSGGWRVAPALARLATLHRSEGAQRLALALALTFGYAAGLFGRLPFWLASALFVFAFIALFEWRAHIEAKARWRALAFAAGEAAVASAAVTLVFRYLFLVNLP